MNYHDEFIYKRHKHGNGPKLIVLMKVGDFYETYDEDARKCATCLRIAPARRGEVGWMTGFPKHVLQNYVARLCEAGYEVVISEDGQDDKKYNINNIKTEKIMDSKKFRTISAGARYMFSKELQSLVEVKPLREVFNMNNGNAKQEWRVSNTDKVMTTHYTAATDEEPEKFDGQIYQTLADFEHGKPMSLSELFYMDTAERLFRGLYRGRKCYVSTDTKGVYIWTCDKGQAVKWYFIDHMDQVIWQYNEDGQISVTSDYDGGDLPEAYYDAEDVYKYNDYRFVDANGHEEVHEAILKRLFLEPDQKKLAKKLQAVIDECTKAGMKIYFNYCSYDLNAVNVRHIKCIEYDPAVDEETEVAYQFDDSRCSHVFKNVTDLNTEDSEVKFVMKK